MTPKRILPVLIVALMAPLTAQAPRRLDRTVLAEDVKAEFLHAWQGYRQYAWGHAELLPVSRGAKDWHVVSLHMTAVDALDTMLIIGLKDEADVAKNQIVSPATTEQMAISAERAAGLWSAIDSLPEKLRVVIVLSGLEGHDVREVARLLDIPEGTVKSRLFLARKDLAERLRWLERT